MPRLLCIAPALAAALALLAGPADRRATAQKKVDHPQLRAALHEMREARNALKDAKDSWPPGYKERALEHIDDAIKTVRTILAVEDVNTFVGVDRNPDYYKRYKDHPRLRAALQDMRDARDELRASKVEGELRERGLDDIDVAVGDIITLIRQNKK